MGLLGQVGEGNALAAALFELVAVGFGCHQFFSATAQLGKYVLVAAGELVHRFGSVDEVVVYGFTVVLQGFFGFFQFGLLLAVTAFKQQGDEHADEEAAEAGKDELGDEGQVVHGIFLCGRRAV